MKADILKVEPYDIKDLRSLMTITDGKIIHGELTQNFQVVVAGG